MASVAILLTVPATALAQAEPDCGGAAISVVRGAEAIYQLPDNLGERLSVNPDDILTVIASGLPSAGRAEFTALLPFGAGATQVEPWSGLLPGQPYELTVDMAEYSAVTRGAFDLEVALFAGDEPLCALSATTVIEGFGGALAVASTAATGVAAGMTAMAVVQGASSANVKLNTQVALRRRRRFLPVVAWRKTIWATLTGGITGVFAAIAFQQTGQFVLDTGTVAGGAATGGGLSLGVGLAWGSLLSLLRSTGRRFEDDLEGVIDTASEALDGLGG
jgi:hypothetical protein